MRHAFSGVMVTGTLAAASVGPAIARHTSPSATAIESQRGVMNEQCTDLVAEKTTRVGRVCLAERGDTLAVRFEALEQWRFAETHLALAANLDALPLAGGRQPVLGRFPYKHEHVPVVGSYVVAIPPADRPSAQGDAGIVVVAHATVKRDGAEEGAWATGVPFTAEGSPAAYFFYRVSR